MSDNNKNEQSIVDAYLELRKIIGVLGIALPFILILGAWLFFQQGMQTSISSYYYTGMRDVLVGFLFAWGFFLFSYRGYERKDHIAGNYACFFALGVALFPTSPSSETACITPTTGYVHIAFTLAFFSTLIYFCLALFTKSSHPKDKLPVKKQHRNNVYKTCGYIMIICMIGLVAVSIPSIAAVVKGMKVTFWLETAAILAFGVSWATKGEAMKFWNDEPKNN